MNFNTKSVKSVDDDGSFERKFKMKMFNASKVGLSFTFTPSRLAVLMIKSGITSSQWAKGVYDLARYGDSGGYVPGNCRFITHRDNIAERVLSEDTRKRLSREGSRYYIDEAIRNDPEYYSFVFSEAGKRGAAKTNAIKTIVIRKRVLESLRRGFDRQKVAYPKFGWKSRLSREWGISKRSLDAMLRLEPRSIHKALRS